MLFHVFMYLIVNFDDKQQLKVIHDCFLIAEIELYNSPKAYKSF